MNDMTAARQQTIISWALQKGVWLGAAASLVSLALGLKAAGGVAAGAVVGVGGLWFWSKAAPWAFQTAKPRFWLWAGWGIKSLVVWVALFLLIRGGSINALTFCIGLGLIPLLLTISALRPQGEQA